MGRDGNFYVQDNGNFRIAVFDNDGEYIRSIGREGEGPGEFYMAGILWIHEETIAVLDEMNRRTSLFHTDGTFIESRSLADFPGRVYLHPANGRNVVISTNMERFQGERHEEAQQLLRTPEVTITTRQGRDIFNMQSPPFSLGTSIFVEGWGVMTITDYYAPRSGIIYDPYMGILMYSSATPELHWYNTSGKHIRTVRLNLKPESVTAEERAGIRRYLDQRITSASGEDVRMLYEERRRRHTIQDTKAFWTGVIVDDFGYHWLESFPDYAKAQSGPMDPSFRVLDSEGEYLGNTTWPISTASVSNGHLLSYHEDMETGEVTFIVYRIEPIIEGMSFPN